MNRFKLTIAYDGTRYHGWQVQPGVPTIQGHVEDTLARILNGPVAVHGSGRTDRGVHAQGQVAHFESASRLGCETLQGALNALLPPDIRILRAEEASPRFHARYSARSRTYQYHIFRRRVVDPFRYRYVFGFYGPLDGHAIEQATSSLVGRHDFTSFSTGSRELEDRVRQVFDAGWVRSPEEWVLTIRANGFLRAMVRTIVGTLLDVGTGRLAWDQIPRILEARDRAAAGPAAPPAGLHLVRVDYDEGTDKQVESNNLSI